MIEKLKKIDQKLLIIGSGLAVVVISLVGFFLISRNHPTEPMAEETFFQSSSPPEAAETTESSEQATNKKVYVDVKGAVKIPGMYQVKATMRVWDVLALAGGVSEEADTTSVNYSQKIADQMIIYVPKKGEVPVSLPTEQSVASSGAAADEKIDLNTATETELQTLSGIGLKKAQEILHYREEKGGFKSVDELKNVAGIGEKTVERLKEFLTVNH